MCNPIVSVVLAICSLLCGCGKRSASVPLAQSSQVDLTTPIAAVKVYGKAMREGDAATAKRAVTNVDPKIIDALAASGASRQRAIDAAVAKFGDDGKTVAGGSALPYGEAFEKMLDEAEVKIDGDTATVTQKPNDATTQKTKDAVPIVLKREGGDWKIDYSELTRSGDLMRLVPVMNAISTVNDELADEIKSGKYATAAEATRARVLKMQQAIMPHPASQP